MTEGRSGWQITVVTEQNQRATGRGGTPVTEITRLPGDVEQRLLALHTIAEASVTTSARAHGKELGRVIQLDVDIRAWEEKVSDRPEAALLRNARNQLGLSIYEASAALYLPAFGSLRLFLELGFASVYFSVHELQRRRWMSDREDFKWYQALDDKDGVLAPDFVREFFPQAAQDAPRYRAQAKRCYSACSQLLHGKIVATDQLPPTLVYSSAVMSQWATTARGCRSCIVCALLSLR
jgi:hypothetical protein